MFETIVGNARTKRHLTQMVGKGRIGQSLLFSGPDGVGKALFAKEIAAHLVQSQGEHPDIHHYHPQGKTGMHSIATLRAFAAEVFLDPFSAKRKVFIIHSADRMLPCSANALLKTFEEPPSDTVIILLTSRPANLLPTILSRCVHVRFGPLTDDEVLQVLEKKGVTEKSAIKEILPLAGGSLTAASHLLLPETQALFEILVALLSKGSIGRYKSFQEALDRLVEPLTAKRQEAEKSLYEEALSHYTDAPGAKQREQIEKEVQGAATLALSDDVDRLFGFIFHWFRDLELLKLGHSEKNLTFFSYKSQLEKGKGIPLGVVEKHTAEAHLSLQRNTTLRTVFETLFLHLIG